MEMSHGETDVPLILFSGMGADASVFASQSLAFPNLVVPDWLVPAKDDDLASYCERMTLELAIDRPCVVGGASFGGIVALEMTRHLDALACLLIGSVRSPSQLPRRIRFLRPMPPELKLVPLSFLQASAALSASVAEGCRAKHMAGVARQFSRADVDVLRWSARQILLWEASYDDVEVRHLHGNRDPIFPVSCVTPDEIVRGGGHVISMTHASQVNEFLRRSLSQVVG
ncbi:alpha/beta fold hydrolase [Rhodopirellula halodulae]|uniref:alpha/beta fold hydrolase n=1 Tax=Rhodopirellula halodulae TaxID=2894198 RepID=UPI001E3DA0E5|nr:alpha/beta hydrolase [Rhodopirellula sp. JC737]